MSKHGEAWLRGKQSFYEESGLSFEYADSFYEKIPQRMPKAEAAAYYTRKLNTVWHQLGFKRKERAKMPEQKTKLQKQFDKIGDDDIINITKGQLKSLTEKVRADAIEAYKKQNTFNADEIIHALSKEIA